MKLIFTGKDGSMSFRRGKIYDCSIHVGLLESFIYLSAFVDAELVRCPYSSFKALFENWMEV